MTAKQDMDRTRRISVSQETDVARVIHATMAFADALGFTSTQQNSIVTAASELTWNIIKFAGEGEITLAASRDKGRLGMIVSAEDQGPGIADVDAAMKDHYSTVGSLGLGLPGVRRLMDEFAIDTSRPRGTRITVRKWLAK